ncbi:hypothetical protein [Parabacteroides timonensis]|uniref:hypothetical protein n=1 Tax=Parabacteroides timonensis TaxID=1871013 RepID=UPI00094E1160|nr:hypothetical protein [Parabacteroides timonensis]
MILTAGGGYIADIVAVANLHEDYDYSQIITWQGLQDSVLVWAIEMPACTPGTGIDDPARRAFIMYSYVRHELAKEENNAFTLAMERLAARIDITNEATPEISRVTCTGTGCSYSDTDKNKKTVSAPATNMDASFSFMAICSFDSDALVFYPEEYTGSEWITVTQGDPVETKASTGIKRSYTINLAAQSAPTEERSALLLIRNAANATARDTIYVKQTVTRK